MVPCSNSLFFLRLKLTAYGRQGDPIMSEMKALAFRTRLGEYLEGFMEVVGSEASRRHFRDYVAGLLGSAERKNMERMAYKANVPVRTLQDFLACYVWDEDAGCGVWSHSAMRTTTPSPSIIDETGVPKKGTNRRGATAL